MGYNLLKGKRGIIFGALNDTSIAWKVAEMAYEEGATFTLSNTAFALRMGKIFELSKQCHAEVIPADVTSIKDLEHLLNKSQEILGGKIDFILHSVGMSKNVIKNREYTDLNYEDFLKTIDISGLSLHKLLQTAYKMDALNKYGSVVTLTYIGAQKAFSTYSDMSQAKAVLESIVRNFGYHYGIKNKVRINSVSQSPTMSSAAKIVNGFDSFYCFAGKMSPLGNATAEDFANYCITLFSDLTKKVTMQNLFHDGGFSSMGISNDVLLNYKPDPDCFKV